MLNNVVAVRLAHGIRRLGQFAAADSSMVYWRPAGRPDDVQVLETDFVDIDLRRLIGSEFAEAQVLQALLTCDGDNLIEHVVNENER